MQQSSNICEYIIQRVRNDNCRIRILWGHDDLSDRHVSTYELINQSGQVVERYHDLDLGGWLSGEMPYLIDPQTSEQKTLAFVDGVDRELVWNEKGHPRE